MNKLFVLVLLMIVISGSSMAAIPEQKELDFEIYRNGKPFGEHRIGFEVSGKTVKTDIKIDMVYKLGFIEAFKYKHRNQEIYKNGQLVSVNAYTYDNGKELDAVLENPEKDILPTTYWDIDMLSKDKLFNTQYGTVNDVIVKKQGIVDFDLGGTTIKAEEYFFRDETADREATVWYDTKTKQWVGLKFTIRGSTLEYKRQTPLTKNL